MPSYEITVGDIVRFRGGLYQVAAYSEYDSMVRLEPVKMNAASEWYEHDHTRRERKYIASIVSAEANLRVSANDHPSGPRALVH